jgi:hypothetical protein
MNTKLLPLIFEYARELDIKNAPKEGRRLDVTMDEVVQIFEESGNWMNFSDLAVRKDGYVSRAYGIDLYLIQ